MEETRVLDIVSQDGTISSVNVLTYLSSDDGLTKYIVYSKDESYGNNPDDKIIYISKLNNINNVLSVSEIDDDNEWNEVQKLLRRIANAV